MADIKKPSYQIVFEQRLKDINESMHSEHHGAPPSREQDTEVKPTKDSTQLGEGSR